MSSGLDMSLDDIIKKNKISGSGNSRGRGRGSGPGPARRFPNRGANRSAPYTTTKAPETTWQHDMFADQGTAYPAQQAGRASAIETGTKLYISNLDNGVSNEDIKELFSEVGDLKRYTIHYDRSGRSKGTAEVVLSRRTDAVAAVKRYNNVQLDGKPMKIEMWEQTLQLVLQPQLLMATLEIQMVFLEVDKVGVAVHSDGYVAVVAAVVAVDLEEVVDVERTIMRRYLLKNLMLIWTSIIRKHQKQCRQIEGISLVHCLALHLSSVTNLCLMSNIVRYFVYLFTKSPI